MLRGVLGRRALIRGMPADHRLGGVFLRVGSSLDSWSRILSMGPAQADYCFRDWLHARESAIRRLPCGPAPAISSMKRGVDSTTPPSGSVRGRSGDRVAVHGH